jgi:hypothetical protein
MQRYTKQAKKTSFSSSSDDESDEDDKPTRYKSKAVVEDLDSSDSSDSDNDDESKEEAMSKDDLRLLKAKAFLKIGDNFTILQELLHEKRYQGKRISMRILEWFVIIYSKEKNIAYELNSGDVSSSGLFRVYKSYTDQLNTYTKKCFDPFCRGRKITFKKASNSKLRLSTNLGQLYFFMWILDNRILNYVVRKYATIRLAKKEYDKSRRIEKQQEGKNFKRLDTPSTDTPEEELMGKRKRGRSKKREMMVKQFTGNITLSCD